MRLATAATSFGSLVIACLGLLLSVHPVQAAHEDPIHPPGCRFNDPLDGAGVTPIKSPPQPLASTLQWRGYYRSEGQDSETEYILLDQGFLRLPAEGPPDHEDELIAAIKAWIEGHPDARVVPVEFIPFGKNIGFTYAWVVAGAENLNVELVRKGLCQGYKMLVPLGKREWRVTPDEYGRFEAAIHQAELAAIAARAGVWAREDMQHDAHWQRAEEFERQRKFTEAVAEFKLTLRGEGYGWSDESAWIRIARCYDAAGDYPAALLAYDKSVQTGDQPARVWNYLDKALCVSKHEGPNTAAAMLERVIEASRDDLDAYRILAEFENASRRFAQAAKALERGAARRARQASIRFDGNDGIIWEPQRVAEGSPYFEDAWDLGRAFSRLGMFYLAAEDPDQALRSCARTLSIARKIMSYPPGRHAPVEIEAGDSDCRLVRAQLFLDRGSLAAAKVELDHVKVLLDSEYTQGFMVQESFEKLSEELTLRTAATNR